MGVLLMKIKMEPPETDSYDNIVISMVTLYHINVKKSKVTEHNIVSSNYRKIS